MRPLVKATVLPMSDAQHAALVNRVMDSGMTRDEAIKLIQDESCKGECWKNDIYTVLKRECDGVVHLSIRRNDRSPARDWRDFQAIKTQLLGPEEEAVEIYPAESRVVDCANQYHLWCKLGYVVPLGFGLGFRSDVQDDVAGFKQRPFDTEGESGA